MDAFTTHVTVTLTYIYRYYDFFKLNTCGRCSTQRRIADTLQRILYLIAFELFISALKKYKKCYIQNTSKLKSCERELEYDSNCVHPVYLLALFYIHKCAI